MTEFWVEEDIQPISHQDSDRLLIEDIERVVDALKRKGIVSWHFLREDSGWRQTQNVRHIRLRFKAENLEHLKRIRRYLKKKLDNSQQNGLIVDHYVGRHGTPVRFYRDYYKGGASENFDEQVPNPIGWNLVEHSLEIGSEMALLLIKGRLNRLQLGTSFNFGKISHLIPNQFRHYYYTIPPYTLNGQPMTLIAYDADNPTP